MHLLNLMSYVILDLFLLLNDRPYHRILFSSILLGVGWRLVVTGSLLIIQEDLAFAVFLVVLGEIFDHV